MTHKDTHTPHHNRALRLLSILLRYPEESWIRMLPELRQAAGGLGSRSLKPAVDRFFSWVMDSAPIVLQERYTDAFDLNPSTSLDLTYHAQGDSEQRGRILSRLNGIYRQAGYRPTTAELPDHMPMVLEFLSCNAEGQTEVLALCAPCARDLAENLETAKSPYSGLVQAAADMMTAMAGSNGEEERS
jgi:nitrate reductase delta subunit